MLEQAFDPSKSPNERSPTKYMLSAKGLCGDRATPVSTLVPTRGGLMMRALAIQFRGGMPWCPLVSSHCRCWNLAVSRDRSGAN